MLLLETKARTSETNRFGPKAAFAISFLAALNVLASDSSHGLPKWAENQCTSKACLLIEYEGEFAKEARLLVETLDLRLCKRGVKVLMKPPTTPQLDKEIEQIKETSECESEDNANLSRVWWIVHLRSISTESILVAVDHLGSQSDDDLIRDVPRGPDPDATAWTLALMIEEAVIPYLKQNQELAPLGAGLAIIEPPAVGGVKKSDQEHAEKFPLLRCVGVGLATYYLGANNKKINRFLLGPSIGLMGLLGPRFVATFSAAWVGTGNFANRKAMVEGNVSHIPLSLIFGFIIVEQKYIDLILFSGVSAGFSIFQTSSPLQKGQRTDVYFDPWIQSYLEAIIHVYGPLAIFVNGGASFPIITDVLENSGIEVYSQDRVMPLMGIGVQLWL